MIDFNYENILINTKPYILGNPSSFQHFSFDVLGKKVLPQHVFNCLSLQSVPFFKLIHQMDQITFGGQNMGMDKWAFFDCAAMPSAIIGFAIERSLAPRELISLFKLDDNYDGLVPISMYMAIPTAQPNKWFGHNLSSLGKHLPNNNFKGLGLLTKAYACLVFQMDECYGATQWGSPAIEIHSQLSPMQLKASYLPVHSYENSLCYLSNYSKGNILKALSGEKNISNDYSFLLESNNLEQICKLQADIENGMNCEINGRPIHKDNDVFYPIKINN